MNSVNLHLALSLDFTGLNTTVMSRNNLELGHPFNFFQLDDSSVAIIDFAFDF